MMMEASFTHLPPGWHDVSHSGRVATFQREFLVNMNLVGREEFGEMTAHQRDAVWAQHATAVAATIDVYVRQTQSRRRTFGEGVVANLGQVARGFNAAGAGMANMVIDPVGTFIDPTVAAARRERDNGGGFLDILVATAASTPMNPFVGARDFGAAIGEGDTDVILQAAGAMIAGGVASQATAQVTGRIRGGGSGSGGPCSFAGTTLVLMGDGTYQPIEEIQVGDYVQAEDPETGERGARQVTHLWVHHDTLVELSVGDDTVVTTEDHPFWNDTDHQWQRADQLDPGDRLLTAWGTTLAVNEIIDGTQHPGLAYNLTVDDIHTYYIQADNQPTLVHNTCGTGGNAPEAGSLPDDSVIVRGGTSDIPGPGEVFSGSYGSTLDEAATGVPHGQIRVSTVGEITAGGGTVEVVPELTRSGVLNDQHVNICLASSPCPFGPLIPNPMPKNERIS